MLASDRDPMEVAADCIEQIWCGSEKVQSETVCYEN